MSVFRYVAVLLATYAAAWTVSYVFIVGFDFGLYLTYLWRAWTFNGLELVAGTWFVSLALFLPASVIAVIWLRRLERRRNEPHVYPWRRGRDG